MSNYLTIIGITAIVQTVLAYRKFLQQPSSNNNNNVTNNTKNNDGKNDETTKTNPVRAAEDDDEEEEETVWQTLSSHWLSRYVLPLFLIYAAVQGHWLLQELILQNPQSISNKFPFLPKLREPVHHDAKNYRSFIR